MKFVIPALQRIAAAARKFAADPELAAAFAELEEAERETEERHVAALANRGIDCIECGQRFLPWQDDPRPFCSIVCRFKYPSKPTPTPQTDGGGS